MDLSSYVGYYTEPRMLFYIKVILKEKSNNQYKKK